MKLFTVRVASILMLLVFAASAQESRKLIDGNLAGSFRFDRYCAPNSREVWIVGGAGEVDCYVGSEVRRFRPVKLSLNGVFANGSGQVWVVGSSGTIVHSVNNGRDWTRQTSTVKSVLGAITCIDDEKCWAVGDGVLLRTNDGGAFWQRIRVSLDIPDINDYGWNAIDFIDGNNGWVAGDHGLIIHTADGGRTWSHQRASIIPHVEDGRSDPSHLTSIKFLTKELGFVCAWGGVARTIDGGKSWQVVFQEPNDPGENEPGELTFIGLIHCASKGVLAIGDDNTPNYYSEDAGDSWKKVVIRSINNSQSGIRMPHLTSSQ